ADGGVEVGAERPDVGDVLVDRHQAPVDLGSLDLTAVAVRVSEGEDLLPSLPERATSAPQGQGRADQVVGRRDRRVEDRVELGGSLEAGKEQPEEPGRGALAWLQLVGEPRGVAVQLVPDLDGRAEEPPVP